LRGALESLLNLNAPNDWQLEIIVVDNGSTDETAGVVRSVSQASSGIVRYVFESTPGVAAARNRGLHEAAGEWVAFFDDDQLADPDWLMTLISFAKKRELLVVGGAVTLVLPDECTWLSPSVRRIFGETQVFEPRPYSRSFCPGTGNLLVHQTVFERIGDFDASLIEAGEDTDLFRRIHAAGISAWFQPAAIVRHIVPADRLTRENLILASRRVGWGFCRRDLREHGKRKMLIRSVARAVKLVLLKLAYLIANMSRRRQEILDGYLVDIHRNLSYLEAASNFLMPSVKKRIVTAQPPVFRKEGRT
jgi:glycosyltransferase involved in cell wall biosynthesis